MGSCSALLGSTVLGAAELSDAESVAYVEMEPYVVVATRTPLSLERVSPSIAYIDAQSIEFWQDTSLIDTLARQTGISLVTSGAIGAQTSLFIRGTESNHTSFFLDGRQLNRGFGNQFGLDYLTGTHLDSVQLQKGASSVNYGSSGIGGVVDSRTASTLSIDGTELGFSQEFGSHDYRNTVVTAGAATERFGARVSASMLSTENDRSNDAYEREFVNTRFDYQITDVLFLEWISQYTYAEKELPGSTAAPTANHLQKTADWIISPGIMYATDELSIHAFYARSESNVDNNNAGAQNDLIVETDEVHVQADYSAADTLLISTGATYRREEAYNSNVAFFGPPVAYEEAFEQLGIYSQAIWQLNEALELRGGLRYDDYSDYDHQTTGSVEAVYSVPDTNMTLFAKAATSYAPPTASDIAFDSNTASSLQPEESQSYEIGWRHLLQDGRWMYSVTFFRNEIDELLSYDPLTFDTFNVQEATTEGVELSVEYALNEQVDLAFGYTFLKAVANQLDDPRTAAFADSVNDVPLARRAKHQVSAQITYRPIDSVSLGLSAVGYMDREDISPTTFLQEEAEDYCVVNTVVNWELDANWSVFARIDNLLDEDYAPAAGYPALGRTGYIGLRASF